MLAAYLRRVRGTVADAEQIVICVGFGQGINLVWTLITALAFLIAAIVAVNGWIDIQRAEDGNKKCITEISKDKNNKEKN